MTAPRAKLKKPLGKEPAGELLRARQVKDWLGVSEWDLRTRVARGEISPFRKSDRAHPFYLKSELVAIFQIQAGIPSKEPLQECRRLFHVLDWLGVPTKELRSWIAAGLIHPLRIRGGEGKFYYRTREIKEMLKNRMRFTPSVDRRGKTTATACAADRNIAQNRPKS